MCERVTHKLSRQEPSREKAQRVKWFLRTKSNAHFPTHVSLKLSVNRDFAYAFESFPETHMGTLHLSCADLLKLFVPNTHRIFSLAASCNTSFWDIFGPVYPFTYDEPRHALCLLEVPGEGLWACVSNFLMTNQATHDAFCELMATEPMSHTHMRLQCRGKHAPIETSGFL